MPTEKFDGLKIRHSYTPAKNFPETWKFDIVPFEEGTRGLYEDAPHNEVTRAVYRLVEPIRNWLECHKHGLTIDRGDWGDGDEFFYISLFSKKDAEEFAELCRTLNEGKDDQ